MWLTFILLIEHDEWGIVMYQLIYDWRYIIQSDNSDDLVMDLFWWQIPHIQNWCNSSLQYNHGFLVCNGLDKSHKVTNYCGLCILSVCILKFGLISSMIFFRRLFDIILRTYIEIKTFLILVIANFYNAVLYNSETPNAHLYHPMIVSLSY